MLLYSHDLRRPLPRRLMGLLSMFAVKFLAIYLVS